MRIEDIDRVSRLRDQREAATKLASSAHYSWSDLCAPFQGQSIRVNHIISIEYVRQAVIEGCADRIADIDEELRKLGVSAPEHAQPSKDAASIRRDLEMYVRVWIRELGGRLFNKRHLIDALAMTTEDMRKRAERVGTPVMPAALCELQRQARAHLA